MAIISKIAFLAATATAIKLPSEMMYRANEQSYEDGSGAINLNAVDFSDKVDSNVYPGEDMEREQVNDEVEGFDMEGRKPLLVNTAHDWNNEDLWGAFIQTGMKTQNVDLHREDSLKGTDDFGAINLNSVQDEDKPDLNVYPGEDMDRERANDDLNGFDMEGRKPLVDNTIPEWNNEDLWGA